MMDNSMKYNGFCNQQWQESGSNQRDFLYIKKQMQKPPLS